MQQFACIQGPQQEVAYMPLHGFTAVDLGYQQGDAVSNIVNRLMRRLLPQLIFNSSIKSGTTQTSLKM